MNKQLMGIKGSFTFIKLPLAKQICRRYSDYNSAAIMLDRTREKKKKEIVEMGTAPPIVPG